LLLVAPPVLKPEPKHEDALALLQVKIENPPRIMLSGFALKFTVGTGGGAAPTFTVTWSLPGPPEPLQVRI